MECLSYCIATNIDLTRLDHHYKNTLIDYVSVKSRDVLKLSPLNQQKSSHIQVFVFKNGTVVSWGVKRHKIHTYLDTIKCFAYKPITFKVQDKCTYRLGTNTSIKPHNYFEVDCLTIDSGLDPDDLRLSLSYGFSQSIKLQYFETILESLIEKYTPLIQGLSGKGSVKVKHKQVRQVIGDTLEAKSEMNLISNFLYHPKYFWQHPTLEEYFIMLERYLHIQRRINAINHRLDTLSQIFEMFNNYLENRHAHHLEVSIVVLITMELLIALLHLHS